VTAGNCNFNALSTDYVALCRGYTDVVKFRGGLKTSDDEIGWVDFLVREARTTPRTRKSVREVATKLCVIIMW